MCTIILCGEVRGRVILHHSLVAGRCKRVGATVVPCNRILATETGQSPLERFVQGSEDRCLHSTASQHHPKSVWVRGRRPRSRGPTSRANKHPLLSRNLTNDVARGASVKCRCGCGWGCGCRCGCKDLSSDPGTGLSTDPRMGPGREPCEISARTPTRVSVWTPAGVSARTPARVPVWTPGRVSAETSTPVSAWIPAQGAARKSRLRVSAQAPHGKPHIGLSRDPNTDLGSGPPHRSCHGPPERIW